MSGISALSSAVNWARSSLDVHSVGMQVGAHNVANVSTDRFRPQRAEYATGSGGNGVVLDTVYKERHALSGDMPISGTELSREMPQMISTQRAFEANAVTIRTSDQMLGTLVDMIA